MRESIKEVLITRDGLTEEEAQILINEARDEFYQLVEDGDIKSFDVCLDFFGLEPDYLEDLFI
jgi:hypothetical protein